MQPRVWRSGDLVPPAVPRPCVLGTPDEATPRGELGLARIPRWLRRARWGDFRKSHHTPTTPQTGIHPHIARGNLFASASIHSLFPKVPRKMSLSVQKVLRKMSQKVPKVPRILQICIDDEHIRQKCQKLLELTPYLSCGVGKLPLPCVSKPRGIAGHVTRGSAITNHKSKI